MNKIVFSIVVLVLVAGGIMSVVGEPSGLKAAPTTVNTAKEIAVVYDQNLAQEFNKLTPQERVFIYYIFRASLPGNIIAADQSHRDAVTIKDLFEYLLTHENDPRLNDIN